MRAPRLRIKTLMIAVAVAGLESFLYHTAVDAVSRWGVAKPPWDEVAGAWVILNIACGVAFGTVVCSWLVVKRWLPEQPMPPEPPEPK